MKDKLILNKIIISISLIVFILILFLILLGNINRKGYLSNFNLNIDNTLELSGLDVEETKQLFTIKDKLDNIAITSYIFTNNSITNYNYDFRIKYYSKIFRNSDIYAVYIDTNNVIKNNNFIKEINIDEQGSPFGILTSSERLQYDEKVDNINYKLRIKPTIIVILVVFCLFIFLFINMICIIRDKNTYKILPEYLNKFTYSIIKYDKYILKYIFISYSAIVIVFIVFVIVNSNIERISEITNLELIAESKAGYVYKAKIKSNNKLFSIDRNSIKVNNTNNIKYYGYALEITNKPLGSWHSTNIYYTENNTFIISNNSVEENAYYYDIQVPTYIGDEYKITILAKQFPNNGIIKWHLNEYNNFKEITKIEISNNYIVLTDTRKVHSQAGGILDLYIIIPYGVTEIESILIESLNDNFNLSKDEIIFTTNNKNFNLNITADLVLQKIFYYIIPFAIILLIILCNPKKLFYKEITINDWILFGFMSILCILSINQYIDLQHTYMSSYAYLNEHILDFYSYNKNLSFNWANANNYMPSTYILFALWNIPFKIFGITPEQFYNYNFYIASYNRLLLTLFYAASIFIIYKISKVLNFSNSKSKATAYLWATTPMAMFSPFVFDQYDIFTLFFILLGIYFYLKNNNFKFILFFAIALTFKYFSLLIFIILLLQREKNVFKIAKSCLLLLIPFILETLMYISDPAFKSGVFGFVATKYIFGLTLKSSGLFYSIDIKLVLLFWIALCAYIYLNESKYSAEKNMLHYLTLFSFIIFGLSLWHAQWIIFITPFLILSTVINKKYNFFIFIDIALVFSFVSFIVNEWPAYLDSYMLRYGIFKNIANATYSSMLMKDIFIDKNLTSFTFFSGILLVNAIFKHPKFAMDNITDDISDSIPLMRFRFIVGIMIFVIPAFLVTLT